MLLSLLIILPLFFGLFLTLIGNKKPLGFVGTLTSLYLLVYTSLILFSKTPVDKEVVFSWFNFGGTPAYIALNLTGLGGAMVLMTTIVFSLLFIYFYTIKKDYPNTYYGLLLITFAGLNGVFLAQDLVLFYFFWEIVLIPMYYLIGIWGSKDRVRANTTFFIYTVFGSMLMLAGIIFIGFYLKPESFLLEHVMQVSQSYGNLHLLAILFMIAFAIKIPLFPLHSWQPAVYKAATTPVTIVLSALMAKMGLFAVVNWSFNLFPNFSVNTEKLLYVVGFGMIYASLIALTSKNVKKIIAFSSIAHLALVFMALFAQTEMGTKGAYFQMFSHAIVVLGMWLSYDYMNRKYNLTDIKSVSGIASVDPAIAVFFTFFSLANLGLPLTSSFIGEFMMINALFSYNTVLTVMACISLILSAAYTLRLLTAIIYGERKNVKNKKVKFTTPLYIVFGTISIIILILGIYPTVIFNLF